MVCTYKRKTDAGKWSQEKVIEAANKVLITQLTLRRAAENFDLEYTSLQKRVSLSRGMLKPTAGQPTLFTFAHEFKLTVLRNFTF